MAAFLSISAFVFRFRIIIRRAGTRSGQFAPSSSASSHFSSPKLTLLAPSAHLLRKDKKLQGNPNKKYYKIANLSNYLDQWKTTSASKTKIYLQGVSRETYSQICRIPGVWGSSTTLKPRTKSTYKISINHCFNWIINLVGKTWRRRLRWMMPPSTSTTKLKTKNWQHVEIKRDAR